MRTCALLIAAISVLVAGCGGAPRYAVPAGAPTAEIRLVDESSMDVAMATYDQHEGCTSRKWLFSYYVDGKEVEGETPYKTIRAGALTSFTIFHAVYGRFCDAHFKFTPMEGRYYTAVAVDSEGKCGVALMVSETSDGEATPVEEVQFPETKRRPWGETGSWCGSVP